MGRVVRKKLTRATQQKLEAVKESRQRSIFTAAAISFGLIFVFSQGTELVFAGFLTLVILQFVLARALRRLITQDSSARSLTRGSQVILLRY